MKRLVVLFIGVFVLVSLGLSTSCVKSSKSCKASQKKIKKMRKSGQIKM
jgi:hypothetical protein